MKRLAILALMALSLSACKPIAPTPGAVAPTFYSGAATAMNGFSTTLLQAQSLFTTAYNEKLVDAATYQSGQKVFLQIAVSGEAIDTALASAQPQSQITSQINALITQISTVPQAFAIKDAQSQAAFTSLMVSLENILKAVESNLPPAK